MRVYLNEMEIESIRNWKACPNSLKEKLKIGEVFLIEVLNTSNRARHWEIYDNPQRTNMSGGIRVSGWLGETNNINRTALGKFSSIDSAIKSLEAEYEIEPMDIDIIDNIDGHLLWMGSPIPPENEEEAVE